MTDHAPEDIETLVRDLPEGSRMELRLWLRLLSCSTLVGDEIRRRLRGAFDVTLPRFDVMAQLDREPDGLRLGDLSRRMMVTNGNITGLVDRLVEEGLVARAADPADRRAQTVRLTAAGTAAFRTMAAAHEGWIHELFADVPRDRLAGLLDGLDALKRSVRAAARERDRGDPS